MQLTEVSFTELEKLIQRFEIRIEQMRINITRVHPSQRTTVPQASTAPMASLERCKRFSYEFTA